MTYSQNSSSNINSLKSKPLFTIMQKVVPKPHDDIDKVFDPSRIRFGMSKREIEDLKAEEKKRKKPAKNWRPPVH